MALASGRRARRGQTLARLIVAGAMLAGCGGSGFQYVKSDEFSAYFKVDEDWRLFDEEEFFASPALKLEPLERQRRLVTSWVRGFDADPQPRLANLFVNGTPAPHGMARIQRLTQQERESLDLTDLREAHLGFDPVQLKRDEPRGPVEILSEKQVSLDGGQHGVRMKVAFDTASGEIAVIDQTALVDPARGLLYLFVVGCSSRCYAENEKTITEIADSWTIEESP